MGVGGGVYVGNFYRACFMLFLKCIDVAFSPAFQMVEHVRDAGQSGH